MLYICIGMECSPSKLNLPSSNLWYHFSYNFEEMVKEYFNNPTQSDVPVFIGFPCFYEVL